MSVEGVFSRPVIATDSDKAKRAKAAQGFGAIFTSMVAAEMRRAMVGEDKGPMGTSGGASGDIYGAMFDQAMGTALAKSPSMQRFNAAIERQLGGPSGRDIDAKQLSSLETDSITRSVAVRDMSEVVHVPHHVRDASVEASHIASDTLMPADSRGPLLLPPLPSSVAPNLPPPSSLEG